MIVHFPCHLLMLSYTARFAPTLTSDSVLRATVFTVNMPPVFAMRQHLEGLNCTEYKGYRGALNGA